MTVSVRPRMNLADALTDRLISPNIWTRIPYQSIQAKRRGGVFYYNDFEDATVYTSATVQAGAKTFQDTGVTIQGVSGDGGILEIAGADAINDDGAIEFAGGGVAGAFSISSTRLRPVAFEARVRWTSLAQMGGFIGLAQPGFAAAGALVDTTVALADKNLIGFHVANATGGLTDTVDAVFRKSSQAVQTPGSAVKTLEANTWYKFGFLFLPYSASGGAAHKLEYFIDNVLVASYTNIAATTFPDGQYLTPAAALKALEASEKKMQLDWVAACIDLA